VGLEDIEVVPLIVWLRSFSKSDAVSTQELTEEAASHKRFGLSSNSKKKKISVIYERQRGVQNRWK